MTYPYIKRLRIALTNQNFDITYINLCCSYAENLLSNNFPVIFDLKHLEEILKLHELKLDSYHTFFLDKNNKKREITAPSKNLKERQRWILKEILNNITLNECCHGFVKNRSIKSNALLHVNSNYIVCMDIHDFFPSININQVKNVFLKCGYTNTVSQKLSELCTHNSILPQGAPTSPYLANVIFEEIDLAILDAIKSKDIVYSRYADDLVFSSSENISYIVNDITNILQNYGFKVNSHKTRIMNSPYRKTVTGLVVTDTVKVPKYFKRKFNQELYYCEKYGISSHLKNCHSTKRVNFKEYMYGKAYYIRMIEPILGEKYLDRLDNLNW